MDVQPRTQADGTEQDTFVAWTCRLPKRLHTRLRDAAHYGHTSMNAIVIEELLARFTADDAARELSQPPAPARDGGAVREDDPGDGGMFPARWQEAGVLCSAIGY